MLLNAARQKKLPRRGTRERAWCACAGKWAGAARERASRRGTRAQRTGAGMVREREGVRACAGEWTCVTRVRGAGHARRRVGGRGARAGTARVRRRVGGLARGGRGARARALFLPPLPQPPLRYPQGLCGLRRSLLGLDLPPADPLQVP